VVQAAAPAYAVVPLFDEEKVYKAGSTIPIRVQIVQDGTNVSAATLPLAALRVVREGDASYSVEPDDPGQSNPDLNFVYDDSEGAPGYRFNLKTAKSQAGYRYRLDFTVGGPAGPVLSVTFELR
jgi:hypothetical protein